MGAMNIEVVGSIDPAKMPERQVGRKPLGALVIRLLEDAQRGQATVLRIESTEAPAAAAKVVNLSARTMKTRGYRVSVRSEPSVDGFVRVYVHCQPIAQNGTAS